LNKSKHLSAAAERERRSTFSVSSVFEKFRANPDRSIDLYFGPTAPAGEEGQWIKTTPGMGWFTYFRIYGPQGGPGACAFPCKRLGLRRERRIAVTWLTQLPQR
jgi:hypothetical protein